MVLQALSIYSCCSCMFNKILYLTGCECQGGGAEEWCQGLDYVLFLHSGTKERTEILCKC